MKVLVTGGAGFIGSHIVDELLRKKEEVLVLDDLSTGGRPNIPKEAEFIKGNITDISLLKKAMKDIDYVFHEAAITSVAFSMNHPKTTWDINIRGTKLLLNAAVNAGVKRFVFASSAAVYGNALPPLREDKDVKPISNYGNSKRMAETLMSEYYEKEGLETISLRYFNCYDKETEILTEDGFKFFKDLSYDDKIATLNPESEELEYSYPVEIQKIKHNGELFHFKSKRIDLMVTADNNMYTKSRKNYFLRKASEIVGRNRWYDRLKQDCKWGGKEIKYEIIPTVENEDRDLTKNRIRSENKEKRVPMNLWVRFLGWFLTEGSVFSSTTTNYGKKIRFYRVSISQKDEKNCNEIIGICKKMGFNPYKNTTKRGISNINIASKQLYIHLKKYKKNKHIPKYIKSLTKEYLEILFEILMKGDGDKDRTRFSTKYERFANDFQELLLKIGKNGRIFKEHNNGRTIYRIKMSKNNSPIIGDLYEKKVYYKKVKYDDYVYDVTIRNHIIFVRRNGFVCWSGNCYGPRQNPESEYSGVISKFIACMSQNTRPVIYGNGMQTRDFIYVGDVVAANMLAMKAKKTKGEAYNIATGNAISINGLVKTLNTILKTQLEPIHESERKGDIKYSFADVSLAKDKLGFSVKTGLESGLKKTVEWAKTKR